MPLVAITMCLLAAGCRVGASHGGRDARRPDDGRIADGLDAARDLRVADQRVADQNGAEGLVDVGAGDATVDRTRADTTIDATRADTTFDTVSPDQSVDTTSNKVRFVFVTAATYQGDLGGVAGADAKCRQAALAANLPNAQQAGSYKAWLTGQDPNSAPAVRFAKSSTTVYTLPNAARTVVAVGWVGLTTLPLQNTIDVTESGGAVTTGHLCNGTYEVFSNTKPDGTQAHATWHCQDWTVGTSPDLGYTGSVGNTGAAWTQQCATSCTSNTHLYCFQQ